MKTSFTLLFFLISFLSQAQRIQGKIVDQQSQPLEYVNIGVVGKDVGTVSTATGQFALTLPPDLDNEVLQISSLGYSTKKWRVGDFKQLFSGPNVIIPLEEQSVALEEVVVRPKDYVTKVVGNTADTKRVIAGFKVNSLGSEVGTVLKIKKPSFLEKVTFNIARNDYDTLFLRINIYRLGENGPEENILTEPIYIKLAKKEVGNALTLDLSQRNIYLDTDVLLSLELVRDLGKGGLFFSVAFAGNSSYVRSASQGTWKKTPMVGLGFNATISQEK